jgi:hypothetical protein
VPTELELSEMVGMRVPSPLASPRSTGYLDAIDDYIKETNSNTHINNTNPNPNGNGNGSNTHNTKRSKTKSNTKYLM